MLELWQQWQPLIIVAGLGFMLLSLSSPFLLVVALVLAVSLSPELPLGLPLRLEDFALAWTAAALVLSASTRQRRQPPYVQRSLPPEQAVPVRLLAWGDIPNLKPWLLLLGIELLATMLGALQGTTRLDLSVYSGTIFLAKSVETFLLYLFLVRLLDTPAKIRRYPWLLLLGGAALAGYGALNQLTGHSHIPGVVVDIEGGPTYSLIALALLPPLALAVALVLNHKGSVRWISMLLLVPIGYAFIFTLSRQAYIGAAAMLGLMLWLHSRRLVFLVVPLLVGVTLYFQLLPEPVVERVSLLTGPFVEQKTYDWGIYSTRLYAWRYRLPQMWSSNPVTGRGLASLPPGFLDSQYLVVLYYTGFLGLLLFFNLLRSFGRLSWQLYRLAPDPLSRAMGLAGLGAIISFAMAGLGGSPFVAVRAREMFWLLMAGVTACSIQLHRETHEKSVDHSRLSPRSIGRDFELLPSPVPLPEPGDHGARS